MTIESKEKKNTGSLLKKMQIYCIIVGLISAILSILIDWFGLPSMAAFVLASVAGWLAIY